MRLFLENELFRLKSMSVKKASRKSIKDQKFGVGAIFKKLYQMFAIKKIMGLLNSASYENKPKFTFSLIISYIFELGLIFDF